MKLVAVSQRVDLIPDRGERRDALDERLVDWLAACGLLAVPVPNRPALAAPWLARVMPAALLLSGGNDVGEVPDRDDTERVLLDWAADHRLPTLGVCRGMQMMAVHSGGRLVEVAGHVATRHPVAGAIAGEVNSYHRWGIDSPPPGYRSLATAADGTVEAMAHEHLPWEGWMWHPEREAVFDGRALARFAAMCGSTVPDGG